MNVGERFLVPFVVKIECVFGITVCPEHKPNMLTDLVSCGGSCRFYILAFTLPMFPCFVLEYICFCFYVVFLKYEFFIMWINLCNIWRRIIISNHIIQVYMYKVAKLAPSSQVASKETWLPLTVYLYLHKMAKPSYFSLQPLYF